MKKLSLIAAALCLSALLTAPAGALEYSLAAPDGPNYGKPTSIEPVLTPDGGAAKNEDLSKNAAVVPPNLFQSRPVSDTCTVLRPAREMCNHRKGTGNRRHPLSP